MKVMAETNSGRLRVELAADAPAGPHLIRLFNEQGSSSPRFLMVSEEVQIEEREPNDLWALLPQMPRIFREVIEPLLCGRPHQDIARDLGMDLFAFKRQNWVKVGDMTGRVSEIRWRFVAIEIGRAHV